MGAHSPGPVTVQTQHWLLAHTMLQRLHALTWRRTMGEKAKPFTLQEQAQVRESLAAYSTAQAIAQTMVRIQPAANDPQAPTGGGLCA